MRIEHGYRPANRWLERPLDERWRRWLTGCIAGAAVVGVSLAAFVGPRQSVMRMRYEIAQLGEEVTRLEREQHALLLEREALTSPAELERATTTLGLEVAPRERVAYLTADGRLLLAPPGSSLPGASQAQGSRGQGANGRPARPAAARGGEVAVTGAGGAGKPRRP